MESCYNHGTTPGFVVFLAQLGQQSGALKFCLTYVGSHFRRPLYCDHFTLYIDVG